MVQAPIQCLLLGKDVTEDVTEEACPKNADRNQDKMRRFPRSKHFVQIRAGSGEDSEPVPGEDCDEVSEPSLVAGSEWYDPVGRVGRYTPAY
jgi:hypothetical protein